ncbi:MAG: hypothetical protein ACYS9X_18545 [Planctomycetota bacterium]
MPARFAGPMVLASVLVAGAGAGAAPGASARAYPGLTGNGPVVVVLDCRDPERLVKLHAEGRAVVKALLRNEQAVATTRRGIEAAGVYGPVSADLYDGANIPCMDNLVNAVVVEGALTDAGPEILRVLRPGGAAVVREPGNDAWLARAGRPLTRLAGGFVRFEKPAPADTDGEWGHWLHGPDPRGAGSSRS